MKPRANTETQVRALLWEELRVAGAIAGVCLVVALMMLGQAFRMYGRAAWSRDEFISNFATLGLPLIAAFLIILNPDTLGQLVGGFSRRILRLPVQTFVAVAVCLFTRTAIVFTLAGIVAGIADLIFDNAPGLAAACLITLVYLAAQTIDWLRGPVRGLSSAVLVAGIMLGAIWIWQGAPISEPLREFFHVMHGEPMALPLAVIVALVFAYPLCTAAIRADRIGRRYGIPEIWVWPGLLMPSRRVVNTKPFHSPMAAQVWFELRRAKFALPIVAVLVVAIIYGAGSLLRLRMPADNEALYATSLLGGFFAVVLGAVAHATQTSVLGIRKSRRKAGYEYLQPLTVEQFATARIVAGAVLLVPTLLAAVAFHNLVAGRGFTLHMLPDAWRAGATSTHEVVWILISRGLLVGIIAWSLLAISTRMFGLTIVAGCALALLAGISDVVLNTRLRSPSDDTLNLVASMAIVYAAVALIRAWRLGLVPGKTALRWLISWMLVAWLFRYAILTVWYPEPQLDTQRWMTLVAALGCSTPVPLVYLAILFDLSHKRARAAGHAQSTTTPVPHPARRASFAAAGLVLAAIVIWLGWPSAPAYLAYKEERGYPATLAELNERYNAPAGENPATQYLELAEKRESMYMPYEREFRTILKTLLPDPEKSRVRTWSKWDRENVWGLHYYVGGADIPQGVPIPRSHWQATEFYWARVSSRFAPALQRIGQSDTAFARYPADYHDGFNVELPHLGHVRTLNRELAVDAFHWTLASKPDKATDSVIAGFALAKSLRREPLLMSQLVHIALIGLNRESIEFILNRSFPTESDFVRLQTACEQALPPRSQGMLLDQGMIGESTIQTNYVIPEGWNRHEFRVSPRMLLSQLVYPVAGSRAAFTVMMEDTLHRGQSTWPEAVAWDKNVEDGYYEQLSFVNVMIGMLLPATTRAYEAEWRARMELQTARAAIAVERYRLAKGALPATLDVLVPDYIAEVPEDFYAGPGVPLKYRINADNGFVVYSVSRNGTDELGAPLGERQRVYWDGDITFTVAPMSFRKGPHVTAHYGTVDLETGGFISAN